MYSNMLFGAAAILLSTVAYGGAGTPKVLKPVHWRGTTLDGAHAFIIPGRAGHPVFVRVEGIGVPFQPATFDASRIASEFKRVCVDTNFNQEALDQAAGKLGRGLQRRQIVVADNNKRPGPSFETVMWLDPQLRVQLWRPLDPEQAWWSLRGRQTVFGMGTKAMIDTRGYGLKTAPGPSCGFTMVVTGAHDAAPLISALTSVLGQAPADTSFESRRRFAFGHWRVPSSSGTRLQVDYGLFDLNRSEQGLHISARPVEERR